MSLSERLAALLSTEEETPEEEEVEKAAKTDKPADKKQAVNTQSGSEGDKPKKLVWKQITLGCKPINVNLSKEVERFNK